MNTNLKVKLVLITPEVATNYLRYNSKNRKVSDKNLLHIAKQMQRGQFLENGESIVFDINGKLTDGQHRLRAIIISGKSFYFFFVTGVAPNAMATFDTGKKRSPADVLQLNGFKNSVRLAGTITQINKWYTLGSKEAEARANYAAMTNTQVLEYCKNNYDWLHSIVKTCSAIYEREKVKVLSPQNLCLFAYFLGGERPSEKVYDFLRNLVGAKRVPETAPNYIYTKLYNAKLNKEPLNFYWVLGMSIKAYNYFIDGNPAVKYFKFSVAQELPKVKNK